MFVYFIGGLGGCALSSGGGFFSEISSDLSFRVNLRHNYDLVNDSMSKLWPVIELLSSLFFFDSVMMDFVFEITSDAFFLLVVVVFV